MAEKPIMLVANESFAFERDGKPYAFAKDESRIMSDSPLLEGIRHLFKPIDAMPYEVESASAAPGEKRGA